MPCVQPSLRPAQRHSSGTASVAELATARSSLADLLGHGGGGASIGVRPTARYAIRQTEHQSYPAA